MQMFWQINSQQHQQQAHTEEPVSLWKILKSLIWFGEIRYCTA